MKEFDFQCDHNIDLFIKCAKDLGAKITPGTGKLFVNGKKNERFGSVGSWLFI